MSVSGSRRWIFWPLMFDPVEGVFPAVPVWALAQFVGALPDTGHFVLGHARLRPFVEGHHACHGHLGCVSICAGVVGQNGLMRRRSGDTPERPVGSESGIPEEITARVPCVIRFAREGPKEAPDDETARGRFMAEHDSPFGHPERPRLLSRSARQATSCSTTQAMRAICGTCPSVAVSPISFSHTGMRPAHRRPGSGTGSAAVRSKGRSSPPTGRPISCSRRATTGSRTSISSTRRGTRRAASAFSTNPRTANPISSVATRFSTERRMVDSGAPRFRRQRGRPGREHGEAA